MSFYDYINKSNIMSKKAQAIYDDIIKNNQNNITHNIIPYYETVHALSNFYNSLGKPLYSPIYAKFMPISDDYNNMMTNIYNDIDLLESDYINMYDTINNSFTNINILRNTFNNKIQYINSLINTLNTSLNSYNGSNIVFNESFNKTILNSKDNSIKNVLSLPYLNFTDCLTTKCQISIDNSSEGLPGNTHVANLLYGNIYFSGQENLHNNLNDLLDNSNDTWYEHEIFSIDNDTLEKCNYYGFNYKESISYITDNDNLTMILNIDFDSPTDCNYISINPYLANSNNATPCILNKIVFMNDDLLIKESTPNQIFDTEYVDVFDKINVTKIQFYFTQYNSYNTTIGHIYYTEHSSSIFNPLLDKRIDYHSPSVESLGVNYNNKTQSVNQLNNTKYTDPTQDQLNDLFLPVNDTNANGNIELINAKRYFIGIESVHVYLCTFDITKTYISNTYSTTQQISAISLNSNEFVPSTFPTGIYIKYYISIDNGLSWLPILPIDQSYVSYTKDIATNYNNLKPYSMYYINSDTPVPLRNSLCGYIDTLYDVNSVIIKIVLTRPSDINNNQMSPIITDYTLNIETGDDVFEY